MQVNYMLVWFYVCMVINKDAFLHVLVNITFV